MAEIGVSDRGTGEKKPTDKSPTKNNRVEIGAGSERPNFQGQTSKLQRTIENPRHEGYDSKEKSLNQDNLGKVTNPTRQDSTGVVNYRLEEYD